METYERFKEGLIVNVDECYLNDEVGIMADATSTATVMGEVDDKEALVMIMYENGLIDYVPQDILEIVE